LLAGEFFACQLASFRRSAAFPPVNSFASWQLFRLLACFCQFAAFCQSAGVLSPAGSVFADRQLFRRPTAFSPTGSLLAGRRVFRQLFRRPASFSPNFNFLGYSLTYSRRAVGAGQQFCSRQLFRRPAGFSPVGEFFAR
jgi:hypothetical protein